MCVLIFRWVQSTCESTSKHYIMYSDVSLQKKKSWRGICRHVPYIWYIYSSCFLSSVLPEALLLSSLSLAETEVRETAGQTDLPKGIDPYGTEKYGSAPASPQNNKLKALQKSDTSRKGKERGTVGICKRRFINQKSATQAKGALNPFYLVTAVF